MNAEPNLSAEIATTGGVSTTVLARERGLDPSTIFRWVSRGIPGASGLRVKLEALRVGKKWLTSRQAIERFFAQLEHAVPPSAVPHFRSPSKRERDSARAAEILKTQYGI